MREIRFRGQRIDTKEWVYGLLLTNHLGSYIITEENPHECHVNGYIEIDEYYRVIPETVGLYTGLNDKNGIEIYDGDIVKYDDGSVDGHYIGDIRFDKSSWRVFWNDKDRIRKDLEFWAAQREIEVIGNIYDNTELLEQEGID